MSCAPSISGSAKRIIDVNGAVVSPGFIDLHSHGQTPESYRFKARGTDLLCELRIDARRAEQGGSETMEKPTGGFLNVQIPPRAKRGEIVRVAGEGMPKTRGGRGDLLVRITYRPEVRITRSR